MAIRYTEILEILKTNHQQALEVMPEDLAAEFQRRVITLRRFERLCLFHYGSYPVQRRYCRTHHPEPDG